VVALFVALRDRSFVALFKRAIEQLLFLLLFCKELQQSDLSIALLKRAMSENERKRANHLIALFKG